MKYLFALFLALPLTISAQTTCSKALDDVRLMCEGAQNACDDLKDCLVRRDTCVESVPSSQTKCEQLDLCMQSNKGDFGDQSRCDYTWAIPSSGEGFCRVKKHFLFSEEGCPGRTHGLLNALAYGLDGTVDNKYDCASVVDKRNDKVKSCERVISEAKSICGQDIPENLNYVKNVACEEAKNFARYTNREFALGASSSARVNDRSRRNAIGAPGSSNTAPHIDASSNR